jgi:hypothetical protein
MMTEASRAILDETYTPSDGVDDWVEDYFLSSRQLHQPACLFRTSLLTNIRWAGKKERNKYLQALSVPLVSPI